MEKELLTREQLHHENPDDLISLILSQQEEIRELRKLTDLMSEEIRGLGAHASEDPVKRT